MAFPNLSWHPAALQEGFYNSEVKPAASRPLPVRTFLPTGYVARYPYPLVVFFHGTGGSEEQILRLAPKISRRNFIAIGLRGPVCLGPNLKGEMGYSWNDFARSQLMEDYLIQAVLETRRNFHVHSERIFLAGFAEGVEMAYRLALTMPDKVAGVISLNGCMPRFDRPLMRLDQMRSFKAYIAHGIANAKVPLSMAKEDGRLLYTAGAQVEFQTYPTNQRIHPDMLRDVNRWIVEQCQDE